MDTAIMQHSQYLRRFRQFRKPQYYQGLGVSVHQRHYTPKHASWLNMVEIEIGVLKGQCLDRRIDTREKLKREIAAWERDRNASGARINWMFTTETARTKMGRAYPKNIRTVAPAAAPDPPNNPS